jgi:hypothetical protein
MLGSAGQGGGIGGFHASGIVPIVPTPPGLRSPTRVRETPRTRAVGDEHLVVPPRACARLPGFNAPVGALTFVGAG